MNKDINSVAVLGSGTMGAGIAALAADNNCKVLLLDISEDAVKKGKERIINEKKPLLSNLENINNVEIGTFENDFHKIKNYDWICEVVVEEIKIKTIKLIKDVDDIFGLVNNAGQIFNGLVQMTSKGVFSKMLDINFFAPLTITQIILKKMIKNREGSIVNISSTLSILADLFAHFK